MKKSIGIVGTGIAGLTCGYHLAKNYDITVFEAEDYIGGHTHTVDVEHRGEKARIDTGFIVFNDRTYPNFIRLMNEIGVASQPTEMSFSVRNDAIDLEYNGHSLATLFAQRQNFIRLSFYRLLYDIIRFNREVRSGGDNARTIGDYLERRQYTELFRDNYLLPMISAIWSMSLESCRDFPLNFFARFFENHGLLDLVDRPQWYTITGGSSSYIEPLTRGFRDNIHLNTPVQSIERTPEGVVIHTTKSSFEFDEVILACHGDQAYNLLEQPTSAERRVLPNFRFSDNSVILHTDTGLLPKRNKAWASWNYRMAPDQPGKATVTYNMNILQQLKLENTYLVSLNQEIDEQHVLQRFNYSHPVYSTEALDAQQEWRTISGTDRIHYCGAYWFNGFHEDGVNSALRVVDMVEAES